MRTKPQKGHEYDNFDALIQTRAERWVWLAARDALLAKMFRKVLADNDFTKYLWQADSYDPDNGSTDSAVIIRWKYFYPYVAGDKQYHPDEEKKAEKVFNSIALFVSGFEEKNFIIDIHFTHSGADGELIHKREIHQKAIDKTRVLAPPWFENTLLNIYTPNTKYMKQ